MAQDRPLLKYQKKKVAGRTTGGRNYTPPPTPRDNGQRRDRIQARFQNIERRLSQVADDPIAVDDISPERLLVFEVASGQDAFGVRTALENMAFLWVQESEVAPFEDEFDYGDAKRPTSAIWATLPTKTALRELLALWRLYQDGEPLPTGTSKIRDLFSQLVDLRTWSARDRLPVSTAQYLQEMLELASEGDAISVEVELWHYPNEEKRRTAAQNVSAILLESNCIVKQGPIDIEGAAYLAILADLPIEEVHRILNLEDVALLSSHDVHMLSVRAQAITEPFDDDIVSEGELAFDDELDYEVNETPFLGVLDGMPLQGHRLLSPFVEILNGDNTIAAAQRVHGTAMASIALYDDLNSPTSLPTRKLVVRPILHPLAVYGGGYVEEIPEDRLFPDILHQAVVEMVGDVPGRPAPYPNIKVINISIGDSRREFDGHTISAAARVLDWLAFEYGVLFIVSAGNYSGPIETSTTDENDILEGLPDIYERKQLSPSEAINVLTVGSFHTDFTDNAPIGRTMIPWDDENLPAPYSRLGPGHQEAVKPDLAVYGGRLVYSESPVGNSIKPAPSQNIHQVGVKIASPGKAGEMDAEGYLAGTSNSAAIVTNAAGRILDVLEELAQADGEPPTNYWDVITKALLVHGCRWPDEDRIANLLSVRLKGGPEHAAEVIRGRTLISSMIGHGFPDIERVISCAAQRVTILGWGELEGDEAEEYSIPMPNDIWDISCLRRIILTVACTVPIEARTSEYRGAQITVDRKYLKDFLGLQAQDANGGQNHNKKKHGTVFHDILEVDKSYRKKIPTEIDFKVQCRDTTGRLSESVRYGLAVTFEIADSKDIVNDIDIYADIRARVETPVRATPA